MSAYAANEAGHGDPAQGVPHVTRRGYVAGFVLAAALTAAAFWLVISHPLTNAALTGLTVMGLAAVQVDVHMVCFLHMNTRSQGGWSLSALLFTALLVFIVLTGSVWVMYHLNTNMAPMSPEAMRVMP